MREVKASQETVRAAVLRQAAPPSQTTYGGELGPFGSIPIVFDESVPLGAIVTRQDDGSEQLVSPHPFEHGRVLVTPWPPPLVVMGQDETHQWTVLGQDR